MTSCQGNNKTVDRDETDWQDLNWWWTYKIGYYLFISIFSRYFISTTLKSKYFDFVYPEQHLF